MLEVFQLEAQEHLRNLVRDAMGAEGLMPGAEELTRMMRDLHTLKGAARFVDLKGIQRLSHSLESRLQAAGDAGRPIVRAEVDLLLESVDLIRSIVDAACSNLPLPPVDAMLERLANPGSEEDSTSPRPGVASAAVSPQPAPSTAPAPSRGEDSPPRPAAPAAASPPPPHEDGHVRIGVERLDRLLGLSGELHTVRMRLSRSHRLLQNLNKPLARVDSDWRQAAALYADGSPDAMARFETILRSNAKGAGLLRKEFESELLSLDELLTQLELINLELGENVMQARMLPLVYLFEPFPRFVRELANRLGKKVHFSTAGENTRVDRDVIETLRAPLVHLLQNAVDHGLELPEARSAAGKPAQGSVKLLARYLGDSLVVTVEDDGRGVDLEDIRARALRRGMLSPERAGRLSAGEVLALLLKPGFTTSSSLTEISGRGVGLDAVRAAVESLRGELTLEAEKGVGLKCHVRLPLSVAVTRVLLCRAGGVLYAFPVSHIDRLLSIRRAEVIVGPAGEEFEFGEDRLRLVHLTDQLGVPGLSGIADEHMVLVVSDIAGRNAFAVDRFAEEEDVIVQVLDSRLGKLRGLLGAAVTRAGEVALVTDVSSLLGQVEKAPPRPREPAPSADGGRRRVLYVEDSRTAREIGRRLLVGAGFEVVTAVDGLEALDLLNSSPFDAVLTDVTMPGLDGFGLTRRIKSDPRLAAIPVVILSYKDRQEDRKRGIAAGAVAYLVKEETGPMEILETMHSLLASPPAAAPSGEASPPDDHD
jgi:two-component system sensor histidine kinase and response regulator WspE